MEIKRHFMLTVESKKNRNVEKRAGVLFVF